MSHPLPTLTDVLRPVRHVLLDFDGPLCAIFSGLSAEEVAGRLFRELSESGELPEGWASQTDPLALLRLIDGERPVLVTAADRALARMEAEAVRLARPTLGGRHSFGPAPHPVGPCGS